MTELSHGAHKGVIFMVNSYSLKTRPDKRLPQLRAGGQGPNLRSLDHLGWSSEAKERKKPKGVVTDRRTDRQTDRRTDERTDKAGCSVA